MEETILLNNNTDVNIRIVCFVLQDYNCILLIPDIFNRAHIRSMVEVVLDKMGFSAVFLIQVSREDNSPQFKRR